LEPPGPERKPPFEQADESWGQYQTQNQEGKEEPPVLSADLFELLHPHILPQMYLAGKCSFAALAIWLPIPAFQATIV